MQAGGACDCGDEDVMKKEGFCDHHGAKDLSVQSAPPAELLAMAQIVVPRLCLRLQKQLKEMDPFIIIEILDFLIRVLARAFIEECSVCPKHDQRKRGSS
ncbi:E3 ubiquitin-protein ligase Ubr3-like isoform X3 [Montipora foliosa]|uniref:E3 ubiquitin-protein ligase Ubr3-like isoform X3 n=1 Tax=Montipora foliosa TaxID=591990 RepID=UPI0035F0FF7C